MLTEFMAHNHFYHYHATEDASIMNLKTIVEDLRALFNPSEWDQDTHEEKLRVKVLHKIHRIRREHDKGGAIDDIRTAFARVVPDDYDNILQIVLEKVGLPKMTAFLTARD